ncbi:MAG: DUF2007 domain-containing protein [Thermotogae bacterium]|nr:DUF2007 domain-containing protein [Thermotogota bacterium]
MEKSKFETAYVAENRIVAGMLQGILEKENIFSFLKGKTAPYTDSVIMGSIGVTEIKVSKEDVDRAREIIDAYMKGASEFQNEEGTHDE